MKKNNNHISIPSKDDFKNYLKGDMNSEKISDFQNQIENDEFVREAIKGYHDYPDAIMDIQEIDKNIQFKTKGSLNYRFYFIAAPSIIAIMVILFVLIKPSEIVNKDHISTVELDTHQNNILNREIEKADILPEEELITSNQAKSEQQKVNKYEKEQPLENIEKIYSLSIKNNLENVKVNPEINKHYAYLPTTYMYDFKVVNYTGIYRNRIKTKIPDGGSLSPKYENYNNSTSNFDNDGQFFYISYNDFLYDAIGKFSANNFKDALKDFNTILQQYPDDLNAHFYGGLGYYNIGLNNKAIEYFDAVLETNTLTFTQEALWYKALTLINAQEKTEAIEILNKIIVAKGFYSDRAEETIKLLK